MSRNTLGLRAARWSFVCALLGASTPAWAHGWGWWWWDWECHDLSGGFTSAVYAGPDCDSPIDFCTLGTLTGDLEGTYAFSMETMVPISDDPAETTFTFTGTSVITTEDGVLYGEDEGQLTFSGDCAFLTFVRVVGGEECFDDASGDLLATGTLDLVTGLTTGTWEAELCGDLDCLDDDHHGWDPWDDRGCGD